VDASPSALSVVEAIKCIWSYPLENDQWKDPILSTVFAGPTASAWCPDNHYKIMDIMSELAEWLWSRDDWHQLTTKVAKGEPLSDNLNTHIQLFKVVAMFMGMDAESDRTKQLFEL